MKNKIANITAFLIVAAIYVALICLLPIKALLGVSILLQILILAVLGLTNFNVNEHKQDVPEEEA